MTFNTALVKFFAGKLGIKTEFVLKASDLNIYLTKSEKIIAICKALGADVYYSGTGAKAYQKEKDFNSSGIELRYSVFKPFQYPQLWQEFQSNVTALDFFMNCGYDWESVVKNQGSNGLMEIGSFIGLDLKETGEFYNGETNIARLNSARAGIYHACRLLKCSSIHIPFYLCPNVKKFLSDHGIIVKPYFINNIFEPINLRQLTNHAVLLVNYFGIISASKIRLMANRFENVIIDNSAAFYSEPTEGCLNVNSPRKFFGVPDGCYVIGNNADLLV